MKINAGVFLALIATCASAQHAPSTRQRRGELQRAAQAALDRELVREKSGDCENAGTVRAERECLGKENETTSANLNQYIAALREMIQLDSVNDAHARFAGPTGIPLTAVEILRQFDAAQHAWENYARAECDAAYGIYQGGTNAPISRARCSLMLSRARLKELDSLYGETFTR